MLDAAQKIPDTAILPEEKGGQTAVPAPNHFNDEFETEPLFAKLPAHDIGYAIKGALRAVFDPEIPVNIYDLGLIYRITLRVKGDALPEGDSGEDMRHQETPIPEAPERASIMAYVDMTLTAPGCPVAGEMPEMVRRAIATVPEIYDSEVKLVWDPPWTQDMMSELARLELGIFY